MSDLFHKDVPLDFIQSVFKTMNECPQHTFRVLTKRSDILVQHAPHLTWSENIWMGVTVERSDSFRIDNLRKVPTKNRFLSLEPLLGPQQHESRRNRLGHCWRGIGPGWRLIETDWIRDIRDQCVKENIPFFFKQYAALHTDKLGRVLDGREWTEKPPIIPYKPPKPVLPQRVLLPPKPFIPFTPKRVFVNAISSGLDQTEIYLEKIKTANPLVEIQEYDGRFEYPNGMSYAEMFHYMKDTVLISERSVDAPFFETFPSPGNCVETINTMVKPTWQCVGKCHYCYLMLTQPHEQYFYTNLDRFENEFATSVYAHRAILAVWNIASAAQKRLFPKIPYHLRNASDSIRKEMNSVGVLSDDEGKEYLYQHLSESILEEMKYHWKVENPGLPCPYNEKNFQRSFEEIGLVYESCAKLPFVIHPSEYADILAVDHLTGHVEYLMSLLSRFPGVSMSVGTRFTNIEGFRNHDGLGRVTFQMNFNTPYAIQEFEPNAPPLENRIATLKSMQERNGYITEAVIEPIIPYSGHRQDYIDLVNTILSGIHKDRLRAFTVGAVRYKVTEGSLPKVALRNFPETKIFETEENLETADRKDGRKRYPIEWRESIYRELIEIIRKEIPDITITLGADIPEVWNRLNLNIKNYMDESVFQNDQNGLAMTTDQNSNQDKEQQAPTSPMSEPATNTQPPVQANVQPTPPPLPAPTEADASIKFHVALPESEPHPGEDLKHCRSGTAFYSLINSCKDGRL